MPTTAEAGCRFRASPLYLSFDRFPFDATRCSTIYRCSRTVWTVKAPINQTAQHRKRAVPTSRNRRGLLRKARLNKPRDINLLAVGVHACAVERLQCVLIGFLRKTPLAFEPLIRTHHPREDLGLRFLRVGDLALYRVELCLQ